MPTPARARRELGFYITVEAHYGTREIIADLVYKATPADTTDAEEIAQSFNPQFDRWPRHAASDYESFQVRAFVENGRCFGVKYTYYRPHEVQTARAEAMTRVLRRTDKAMKAAEDAEGYLPDYDFTSYLLRVARVVGADYFDWRPYPRAAIERTDAEGIGSAITGMLRVAEPAG